MAAEERRKQKVAFRRKIAAVAIGALILSFVLGVLVGIFATTAIFAASPEDYTPEAEKAVTSPENGKDDAAGEEATPEPTEAAAPVKSFVSLGVFKCTAYCPCEKCCGDFADGITATGTKATQGRTIAVDPSVIPYGTTVFIDGTAYVAEDCGGAIKNNRIDVYFDTHADALIFGVKEIEIFIETRSEAA